MTDVAVKQLPIRQQDEPFVAYKHVELRFTKGLVTIRGSWAEVLTDDKATCRKYPAPDPPHDAPFPDCECGFWALKDKPPTVSSLSDAVATVEVFGTVIHAAKGYRASRQRILALEVGDICEGCSAMHDERRVADAVYFDFSGDAHPLCVDHGSLSVSINAAVRLTLADIAARVGTEVGWMR